MAVSFLKKYDRDGNLISSARIEGPALVCLGANRFLIARDTIGGAASLEYRYTPVVGPTSAALLGIVDSVANHDGEGTMVDGKHLYLSVDPTGIGSERMRKIDWGGNVISLITTGSGRRDHAWQRQSLGCQYRYGNRYLKINQTVALRDSTIEVYSIHLGFQRLIRSVTIAIDDPSGVCTDGRYYYVTSFLASSIYTFSLDGHLVRTVTVPSGFLIFGIDYDGKYFWCVGSQP